MWLCNVVNITNYNSCSRTRYDHSCIVISRYWSSFLSVGRLGSFHDYAGQHCTACLQWLLLDSQPIIISQEKMVDVGLLVDISEPGASDKRRSLGPLNLRRGRLSLASCLPKPLEVKIMIWCPEFLINKSVTAGRGWSLWTFGKGQGKQVHRISELMMLQMFNRR